MVFIDVLFAVVIICATIYAYFKHRFNFWERHGIGSLPTKFPLGNLGNPRSRIDPFYESVRKTYNHFKALGHKHAGFYMTTRPYYMPLDLELIKNILLKDFTSFVDRGIYYNEKADPLTANLFFTDHKNWRTMRVKMTPTFTSAKMKMMFHTLLDCTEPMVQKISELNVIDAKEIFSCYATDVIGSCAFGLECNSFKRPDAEFRRFGRKVFEFSALKSLKRLFTELFPDFAHKIGVLFLPVDVSNFFNETVKNMVEERERTGNTRKDFMQMLIQLKHEGVLNMEQVAAQCFVFFIAGYETSSTAVTYCLYELAKRADIQKKIRLEIAEVKEKHGGITYEGLNDMKYLGQVINETLRMYPPLPVLVRACTEDYKIKEDFVLRKGERVFISIYGMHMDEEYFSKPNDFDPERFSEENSDNILPFTFMPFGEGPRNCIGMRFGLMQTKVGLVSILENFRLKLNEATPQTLSLDPNSFVLRSKENILLDVERVH